MFIEKYIGKKNLLEIGCGNGYFWEKLITSGFEIEGNEVNYRFIYDLDSALDDIDIIGGNRFG
ncbi:MAG: class I SAM-dependent methyltransferase [Lactobacillales bacterium]|jgi:2-polyprenyl-3-methyl-5-hydroxy-6-metoxy-1,4-benzoquinol methylase|nr:class I SAM-dependent methyltransferase [Lactobacillales bacterium]